jgi:hypothetical protein
MTKQGICLILNDVSYKDWDFSVLEENGILFLQISLISECACRAGLGSMEHYCRKWRLSPRITKSEVVQTAFMAVMAAEEHEARENFKFKVAAVFSPHFDIEALVSLYKHKRWDMRINSRPIVVDSSRKELRND